MPLKWKHHRPSGKCNLCPTDSFLLLICTPTLFVLKQTIIRDLKADLQAYRVTSVLTVLKCSDTVLQLEHLTASWQKQKRTRRMEKEGGYRMAGACLVPMSVSNGRCGAQPFHLPCSIQPHSPSSWTIFLPSAWATQPVTLGSLHHSPYRSGMWIPGPSTTLPFLGQLAEAGGYCWDPAPSWPPATQQNGCATSETSGTSLALEPSQAPGPTSIPRIYAASSMRSYYSNADNAGQ